MGVCLNEPFRGAWQNLNFDKEYLFGFETLVFATSGILSMHNQILTSWKEKRRERKTWNRNIWPFNTNIYFLFPAYSNEWCCFKSWNKFVLPDFDTSSAQFAVQAALLIIYIYIYISGGPLSALTCCVNVRVLSAIKKISPLIYSQSWVGSWVYTTQAMMTFTLIF